MQRLAIFLCSIACFVAVSLPLATPEKVVVIRTEKPAPRFFYACEKNSVVEHRRACHARGKSI